MKLNLPQEAYQFAKILSYAWIVSAELIKVGYVSTCDCQHGIFSYWFFPTFQHWPYTSWFVLFGTIWLGGPYSLFWYGLDSPAFFGYWIFFPYLLAVDLVVFCLLWKKGKLYALYGLTLTLWFTTVDPVDFFPIIFALAGRYWKASLFFAPIVKLPVGAPIWVWQWAFTSSNSLKGPENYGRYLLLGVVWMFSLVLYLHDRKNQSNGTVQAGNVLLDPDRRQAGRRSIGSLEVRRMETY